MKRIYLTLLICAFYICAKAQIKTYSDAGMWNTLSVNMDVSRKLTILFAEEIRLRENYSQLNLLYTNMGLEYEISNYFKTSIVYRFIDKWTYNQQFSFRHRIMWDFSGTYKYRKMSFSYRHRLQAEKRNIFTSETGRITEWYSRSKIEANYKLNTKFIPYLSTEFRYQISDYRNRESNGTWHRVRYQAGVDYKLSKKSKLGVYYLVQHEYNVPSPENLYITGIEYTLNIKASDIFKQKKVETIFDEK